MTFSWVSMSSILLLVVFVLLTRLVRGIDRKRHPVVVAQVTARDIMEESHPAFPRDHAPLCQRTDMMSNPSPGEPEGAEEPTSGRHHGVPVPRRERAASPAPAASPQIRWGRTAIALIGLAALLAAAVTAVLSPFTAVPWPVPVFLVIVGFGAMASLRYLALSDREERRSEAAPRSAATSRRSPLGGATGRSEQRSGSPRAAAAESADSSVQTSRETTAAASPPAASTPDGGRHLAPDAAPSGSRRSAPRRLTAPNAPQPRVFDRASAASSEVPSAEASRKDLDELRAQARRSAAQPGEAFRAAGDTWEPVAVPKPTYVDAPEAHHERPEPLEPPAEPEAHSKNLEEASGQGGSIDLDDVLSRRRA